MNHWAESNGATVACPSLLAILNKHIRSKEEGLVLDLLKILGTRAGREYGIRDKITQDKLGLRSLCPCLAEWLSSAQDRLGLTFFSCCAGSDGRFM